MEWREYIYSVKPNIARAPGFDLYFNYNVQLHWEKVKSDPAMEQVKKAVDIGKGNELGKSHRVLESVAPRLFLFLPSDLSLWDDTDPFTHSFRLYFLCDCEYNSADESSPTYVHISNHSGYEVNQPLEFIRQFGYLSRIILETLKSGYINHQSCIPQLDTYQILQNFGGNTIQHHMTPATIGPLVDKAIAYIHMLQSIETPSLKSSFYFRFIRNDLASSFQWDRYQELHLNESMNGTNTRTFDSFLRKRTGDTGMGGLNRVLSGMTARWLCQRHVLETYGTEKLEQYVGSQGGGMDLQLAITMDLDSLTQVDAFATTLSQNNRCFDLSVNLTWSPSMNEVLAAIKYFSKCHSTVLQINGAPQSILNRQQSLRESSRDPFASHMGLTPGGMMSEQLIILPSYPQPSESYIYFGRGRLVYGFLFEGLVNRLNVDWIELGDNMHAFEGRLRPAMKSDDQELDEIWIEYSRIVKPLFDQGLKVVDLFHPSTKMLQCRLGVKDGVITGITDIHLSAYFFSIRTKKHPALQRLVFRPDVEIIRESLASSLHKTVAKCPSYI